MIIEAPEHAVTPPKKRHWRSNRDGTLVLATHNAGKIAELSPFLAPYIRRIMHAGEFNLTAPEETAYSLQGNAALKALAVAKATHYPSLADDSGLSINALGGMPGVYSADWAQNPDGSRDFAKAMQRVQEEMGDSTDRSASFVTVLALAWPDGHVEYAQGQVDGEIIWPPRGKNGFGYDPIFLPNGSERTFAEMEATEKRAISHRMRALDGLIAQVLKS